MADVTPGTAIALETAEGTPSVKVFEPSRADRKGGVIFYMGAFGLRPELWTTSSTALPLNARSVRGQIRKNSALKSVSACPPNAALRVTA